MDNLTVYFLTFNCARNLVDINWFAAHFFDALPLTDTSNPPELIALSLQEIAPIAYSFLGGSFLVPYLARFNQVVESAVAKQWENTQYVNLKTKNVGMTALMVFARTDIAVQISSVVSAEVGFGLQEMGNKGAVGARVTYSLANDATMDLTFLAAHLAPMENAVGQRNDDWRSMVERLVFRRPIRAAERNPEVADDSESTALLHDSTATVDDEPDGIFNSTGYLFLAGDLNYRTSDVSPQKDDQSRFPKILADPTSSRHYSNLLKEDQLAREMGESRTFHGLSEAPITFPPTYKYTSAARQAACDTTLADESQEWLWTSTRWPSWCDRVLYLEYPLGTGSDGRVSPLRYTSLPLFPTSDHRAVALSISVPVRPMRPGDGATRLAAPFSIDPEWERKREVARKKELVVGCLAYFGCTWEGNAVLVSSIVGVLGAWLVLRSLLNG
ncbi:hypothetical protein FE257_009064 [Aspergillus nanangensis]|uniref:Inositol polyphosphate-related phosphatase domain-containing protein n=1 Tax=Aspergillus nanangensis TaxID=2582783 RepID=A0AAD4CWM9_ASPNN|nr:hypothetical protein FE257_009064 [Aspergillus nanangensis]